MAARPSEEIFVFLVCAIRPCIATPPNRLHTLHIRVNGEDGNRVDPFAVAVMRGGAVIGHVPRKISSIRSLYLRRGGSIAQ